MTDPVINMEPGNLMKLVCQVDGMPVPTVSWFKVKFNKSIKL